MNKKEIQNEIKRNKGILGNDIIYKYRNLRDGFITEKEFLKYVIKRTKENIKINKKELNKLKELGK